MCHYVSVAVGTFSERLTDTSFSLSFFFSISLAMVKTDVKNVFWKVFFSRPDLPFFFFFYTCAILLLHPIVGFVFKTEGCPLCSEFSTGLCYTYKLHDNAFPIPLNFFSDRTRCDFVLSLQANTGISPIQKQHELKLS